jgi:HPt (histidine-containing phosphotransfer) domain-containing protein
LFNLEKRVEIFLIFVLMFLRFKKPISYHLVQDAPVRLEELNQALADNDAVLLTQHTHAIEGASANIGAHALREVAFEMEMAGRERRLDRTISLVERLERELDRLKTALQDFGCSLQRSSIGE